MRLPIKALGKSASMAIYRLLENHVFEPELVRVMTTAFEGVLVDRAGQPTNIIAKRIAELAITGERDPRRIRDQVLHSLDQDLWEAP
jgi:hypothetical protein